MKKFIIAASAIVGLFLVGMKRAWLRQLPEGYFRLGAGLYRGYGMGYRDHRLYQFVQRGKKRLSGGIFVHHSGSIPL